MAAAELHSLWLESLPKPARMGRAFGYNVDIRQGLHQRNHPVATWMYGSCRGAIRPLVNELHHSFLKSTTRLPCWAKPEPRCSRSVRRHPPKRQGPRPKILLDPMPRASSWSTEQEEEKAKSCCSRTTPQKASVTPTSTPPHSFPGVDDRMFVKNTVVNIGSFHIAPTQPIAVIEIKIKHKHIKKDSTFPLPLITSLRPLLGSPPLKTIKSLPHGPRHGGPSSEFQTGFWG